MPDLIETLEGAKNLLLTKGWTQGELARNADGTPVKPHWQSASCFCLSGAVLASGKGYSAKAFEIIDRQIDGQGVVPWNDTPGRTLDEVIAVLNRAIAAARQQTEAAR